MLILFYFLFFFADSVNATLGLGVLNSQKGSKEVSQYLVIKNPQKEYYIFINPKKTCLSLQELKESLSKNVEDKLLNVQTLRRQMVEATQEAQFAKKELMRYANRMDEMRVEKQNLVHTINQLQNKIFQEPLLTQLKTILQLKETKEKEKALLKVVETKKELEENIKLMSEMVKSLSKTFKPIRNLLNEHHFASLDHKKKSILKEEEIHQTLTCLKDQLMEFSKQNYRKTEFSKIKKDIDKKNLLEKDLLLLLKYLEKHFGADRFYKKKGKFSLSFPFYSSKYGELVKKVDLKDLLAKKEPNFFTGQYSPFRFENVCMYVALCIAFFKGKK